MTKTVSSRINNKNHQELLQRCNKVGCTINEWINEAIQCMLTNSSEFNFGDEDEGSKIESKRTEINDTPEPRIFDCKDGFLFENEIKIGNCADYKLDDGKVHDDRGNFLGKTRDSLKPIVTEIEQ